MAKRTQVTSTSVMLKLPSPPDETTPVFRLSEPLIVLDWTSTSTEPTSLAGSPLMTWRTSPLTSMTTVSVQVAPQRCSLAVHSFFLFSPQPTHKGSDGDGNAEQSVRHGGSRGSRSLGGYRRRLLRASRLSSEVDFRRPSPRWYRSSEPTDEPLEASRGLQRVVGSEGYVAREELGG